MWHKAIWKGHPMRLELTRVGLLVELANHYTTRGASLGVLDVWLLIHIYHHHHHHHIALVAQISLTFSRHSSLSFIALGRSSGQHPVSSHSCWMYVRAGHPAFARPCVGVHKSTSLMSSSLLLQQCPACLVRLTWIVFVIEFIYIYIYIYIWENGSKSDGMKMH